MQSTVVGIRFKELESFSFFCYFLPKIQFDSFLCLTNEALIIYFLQDLMPPVKLTSNRPLDQVRKEASHHNDYYFNYKLPGTERPEGQFKTMHDRQFWGSQNIHGHNRQFSKNFKKILFSRFLHSPRSQLFYWSFLT